MNSLKKKKQQKVKMFTCEMCGVSYDARTEHQCDPSILGDKEDQIMRGKETERENRDKLKAGEMYLRDF